MALHTWPKFLYSFEITSANLSIPFDEGSGELIAQARQGSYAPSRGLLQIASAMNDIGGQTYSLALDRATRLVTVSATDPFDLLVSSGTPGNSIWSLIGFTGSDRTGSNIYTGNLPIAKEYLPQFKLQDYVPKEHSKAAIDPAVKTTADGTVEVVRFGVEQMISMNLRMITNRPMDGRAIRNNPQGLEDAIDFFDFLITKAQFEFMPDEDDPNTFIVVQLDSTPKSKDGTAYELEEMTGRNLPDFYESGRIKLRVIA